MHVPSQGTELRERSVDWYRTHVGNLSMVTGYEICTVVLNRTCVGDLYYCTFLGDLWYCTCIGDLERLKKNILEVISFIIEHLLQSLVQRLKQERGSFVNTFFPSFSNTTKDKKLLIRIRIKMATLDPDPH